MVEFFKCWKYPSNSSETFKILFFHQNNQFEAKTACFADFSILTKIAVSGPYRRGHFLVDFFGWVFQMLKIPFEFFWNIQNFVLSSKQSVWSKNSMFCGLFNFDQNRCIRTLPRGNFVGWFFWLSFSNVENKPSNSSETFKILFFHQNNQFDVLRTFQFWPKSLYPDLTGFLVDFFGWFFWLKMLKIPFEFFWNIQNFVLSSKQSVWSKNSMFCGLFNFDQNRCIRTLPAWQFCWLIFLVEFFKCWKYPSNSSETFKILFFHQNNQFEAKTACFADFSILTKIAVSGPYRRGHFLVDFFWLSFSNVENTLRILLKHSKFCSFIKTISLRQKQHVLRTFQFWPKSLYPDLTGVAILLVDFFGWVFQMLKIPFEFFWNIQNFVLSSKQSVWSKNSMFCGLFNFDQNRCIRTLPAWPFFDFFVDFFGWFFEMLKIPFEFFWNIQNFVLSSKQSVWGKNSMFCGLFNFDQNRCIRTLPAWPFFSWFFWLSFSNVENTLRILLKHSKFCSFIKTISLKQKQHVLRTFQFWPKSLYPDLTGVAILLVDFLVEFFKCWKYPSNSSETFKILFFHQNNQFEAKTACFADFSILTKIAVSGPYRVAILLVDFFGWVFQMLKIPFEFFWNIQNFVLSSKQSVWSKNSMFCGLFNFDQNRCIRTLPAWPFFSWFFWLSFSNVENTLRILLKHSKFCSFIKTISLKQKQHVLRTFQFWPKSLYPDLTGVAILLVDFFGWVFQMLKIPFEFFWNIQNFVLSSKQSVWGQNSMFCGLFNFDQNRCIRTLPAWPFFSWFFWLSFSNVENTLRILLKHSKFCSFIKTISLKQKQHVLRTFQFWPKSLYPDLTGVAIF